MVNFDDRGVATPESQAFIQEHVNKIINNQYMLPFEKEARLRDLYNEYGLKYGSYERRGEFHQSYRCPTYDFEREHKSEGSGWAIALFLILMMFLCGFGYVNGLFNRLTGHDLAKTIEHFFQWLFS